MTSDDVRELIASGDLDGDLVDVIEWVRDRLIAAQIETRWVFRWDGHEWPQESVTMGEARMIQRLTGLKWHMIDPLDDAEHLAAFFVSLIHHRLDVPVADAEKQVNARTADEMAEAVGRYAGPFGERSESSSTT